MIAPHDHEDFDTTLLRSALEQAALHGWRNVSLVTAARDAGLPVEDVRARFPVRAALLMRLGRLADESALRDDGSAGSVRERLFDVLMRRIDVLQQYRDGVRAVLRALPTDPGLTAMLGLATMDSMRWMADAAGLDTGGIGGLVRINALAGIWLHGLRAWERDDSADLGTTMAAFDTALDRADRFGLLRSRPHDTATVSTTNLPDLVDLPLES